MTAFLVSQTKMNEFGMFSEVSITKVAAGVCVSCPMVIKYHKARVGNPFGLIRSTVEPSGREHIRMKIGWDQGWLRMESGPGIQ